MNDYYSKMAAESDAVSNHKFEEKLDELKIIFSDIHLTERDQYKLAVLGCGDKRHMDSNTKIFEKLLGAKVENTTYDIETKHLDEKAFKHDCTKPLPETDFDITYAHVLLKFIPLEKQTDLIKSSYGALTVGGIAIHIIDSEDIVTKDNNPKVDFNSIQDYLNIKHIKYVVIKVHYGVALVLLRAK